MNRPPLDRARLQANLEATAAALLAMVRLPPQLAAMGPLLRPLLQSSISETCRELAQLPDADLWALLDLLERELDAIREPSPATRDRDLAPEHRQAIGAVIRVLSGSHR